MYANDARAAEETEQRLYMLSSWEEAHFFTDRERAILTWIEAVKRIADRHLPDEVYELARRHFSKKVLVDLSLAIMAINSWHHLNITFRTVPGTYQPAKH